MRKIKAIAAVGAGLILAGTLAGCTASGGDNAAGSDPADVQLLAAGEEATGGVAQLTHTSAEGDEAVFQHTVSTLPATDEQSAAILETAVGVDDYEFHLIRIVSNYVSGADLAYNSFTNSFAGIDASGVELVNISQNDHEDFCPTATIPDPGTDETAVIENCIIAAVPAGGEAPAGAMFAEYSSQYDRFDGKPALVYFQ